MNKIFIFIIIFSLLLLGMIIWYIGGTNQKLSENDINDLYHLTDCTDKLLKKNKIEYSICCGTVLGAVRDGGLIPWDHDVDVMIHEKDIPKLEQLGKKLKSPYSLRKNSDHPGLYAIHYKDVHVDLWPIKDIGGKYHYTSKENRQMYRDEWITEDELYPLNKYKFGPLILEGPNKPEIYLKRVYGNNWMYPSHYSSFYDRWLSLIFSWINKLRNKKSKCALPTKNITCNEENCLTQPYTF